MKTQTDRRTLFVFLLVTTTGSLPLLAQPNPTLSRFNVGLGAIRAPSARSEMPVMSSDSWLTLPNASVTADGTEIFLSNDVGSGHDLYFASRASPSDPWGIPQLVGAPVNTPYAEFVPWISADGLIWYGPKAGPFPTLLHPTRARAVRVTAISGCLPAPSAAARGVNR